MNQLAKAYFVRELTFSGRIFSGTEALTLGLATRVCEDPVEQARALAHQIACWNPDTMRENKRLLNLALDAQPADVLFAESKVQQRLIGSPNQRETVRAAVEKRRGRFADPSPGD